LKLSPYILICIFCFQVLSSCRNGENGNDDIAVARVHDSELMLSDLVDLIPNSTTFNDSVQTAQTIINKWITRQIKLAKAETYLTPVQKELEKQLEEYRSSLIIYRYEQELIRQKLDTVVTAENLSEYYNEFAKEFVLQRNAVKIIYAQVEDGSPDLHRFKRWLRNYGEDYKDDIEDYAKEFAILYQDYQMNWVYFNDVMRYLPNPIENPDWLVSGNHFDEFNDGENVHLIKIVDHKLNGEVAPLNLVESNIRNIILNKRKLQLVRDFEKQSFDEAMNNSEVEIYKL
jgi:hypothetical protein